MQEYANSKGVDLIGDMPIYVGGQSADVWANPQLFELGAEGAPEQVSGVPPDAFSETGQLWGSPLYRWDAHAAEDYEWWAQRIGRAGQVRRAAPVLPYLPRQATGRTRAARPASLSLRKPQPTRCRQER